MNKENKDRSKPNIIRIMQSTLAAAFGVQTDKNRQEDFSSSSIIPYIAAGLVFTLAFILILMGIVYLVIGNIQQA